MEFRHIRSFLSVAETLHFGRSAQLLNLSQPRLGFKSKRLRTNWVPSSLSSMPA